jgi:hypothetical protein
MVDCMSLDPVVTNGKHYRVVFENDRVRVLEYTDQPGAVTTPHQHPDSVMYTCRLSAGDLSRATSAGGGAAGRYRRLVACAAASWGEHWRHPTHVLFVELKDRSVRDVKREDRGAISGRPCSSRPRPVRALLVGASPHPRDVTDASPGQVRHGAPPRRRRRVSPRRGGRCLLDTRSRGRTGDQQGPVGLARRLGVDMIGLPRQGSWCSVADVPTSTWRSQTTARVAAAGLRQRRTR